MPVALYRRYRPERFDQVIGQEHVTDPLQRALRHDRISHAYLFSGPRGCGKTTSARILARCLNCEKGPTPHPCGVCDSCVALARGGPGSVDVIEIDAASHGGVDDARDLRERAFFAPASSRFKIYIIDEAHMVSPAGFNALLKVVEEPPAHVKFIFATTEPEKVIATIRSRTHHYPFRLVPPGRLQDYLAAVCADEGVAVEKGVLPLVVRAGRGSVRDSLSVLDQLLAGAEDEGVTYRLALSLLGYTDAALLDETVEAFAAADGAAVFRVIDRAMEGGSDPRRFTEDLLERLRDLVVLDAVPDAPVSMFGDVASDQLELLRQQAGRFGSASLSRAADIVNAGLTEMRGAIAPRLQLELICARVLLPAASGDDRGTLTRLERLERRLELGELTAPPRPAASPVSVSTDQPITSSEAHEPSAVAPLSRTSAVEQPAAQRAAEVREDAAKAARPAPKPAAEQPAVQPGPPAGGLDLAAVRRAWPEVLEGVKRLRRFTWTLLSHNASVAGLDGKRLTLAMINAGARDSFVSSGSDEIVRQALIDALGVDWRVEAIVDPSRRGADTAAPPATEARAPAPQPVAQPAPPVVDQAGDEASMDDDDQVELSSLELLRQNLGAQVIGEYDN